MNILGSSLAVWYLMRASGVMSLVLLTAVFALGIATAKRWYPVRLPRFVTAALHRSISLLSVVFLAIHVATAVIDPYAHVGLVATIVVTALRTSPDVSPSLAARSGRNLTSICGTRICGCALRSTTP